MATKRPLDFIPEPVPAWKTALPIVALGAAGLVAWGWSHVESTSDAAAHSDVAAGSVHGASPERLSQASAAASPGDASATATRTHKDAPLPEEAPAGGSGPEADAPSPGESDAGSADAPLPGANAGESAEAPTADPSALGESPSSATPMPSAAEVATDGEDSSPRPAPVARVLSATEIQRAERAAIRLRPAIAEGRVSVAGDLFVVVEPNERAWASATTVCKELSIDGVSSWKLASRSEVRSLDRSGVLPQGAYWTRNQSSRDVEAAYAYDTRQRRSVLWLKQEPNGTAVCIQPRVP